MKTRKHLAIIAIATAIVVLPVGLVWCMWDGGLKGLIHRLSNLVAYAKADWNYDHAANREDLNNRFEKLTIALENFKVKGNK